MNAALPGIDDAARPAHDDPMNAKAPTTRFVWFDLEFTDLDPAVARLLQVAVLVTDAPLQRVQDDDRGLNLCIRLETDAPVSPWVQEHLADLLTSCRSESAVSLGAAQEQITAYLDRVCGPCADDIKDRPVLAGNSVHNDWRLACAQLPEVMRRLHYRLLDVTAYKIHWENVLGRPEFDKDDAGLVQSNLPFAVDNLAGKPHDAYYDILASIAELNFYRKNMLTVT